MTIRVLSAAACVVLLLLMTAPAANTEAASIDATVAVNPLQVDLRLSRHNVEVGERFRAEATVVNLGTEPVSNLRVELHADRNALRFDPAEYARPVMTGHSTATFAWGVCARSSGNFVLLAGVTGESAVGRVSTESLAEVLAVAPGDDRACR